ncbi:hypothetical protein ATANTOWER_018565 [Ataeniobius toweri]|uniref:Uncharacterized protein n=1 Tax=Ataeniobius toweri TaxID=208326 RepID=A0ABU7AGE1_9TELE|nr:hypothetical protein [Ataeniobius toweri]
MAKMHGLYVVLLTALSFWKYCLAEWNATNESSNQTACHLHGKKGNCTVQNLQIVTSKDKVSPTLPV